MNKLRRSLLFIPGNNPGMIQNAGVFDADGIIFDLEDAVSVDEKDAARDLVSYALQALDFTGNERVVRVNPLDTEWGQKDVEVISKVLPDTILVPKATEEAIIKCHEILDRTEIDLGLALGTIRVIALIETAYGVERASEIVQSSTRVDGVLLGGEDFTADMEIERTSKGQELFYARTRLSTLCRAYKLEFIDTPYADVNDMTGFKEDLKESIRIGATGKAAINPRQIEEIHNAFTPSRESVEWAERVVQAWAEAQAENKGVFSLQGKMVDAPVVARAEKVLAKIKTLDLKGGSHYVESTGA